MRRRDQNPRAPPPLAVAESATSTPHGLFDGIFSPRQKLNSASITLHEAGRRQPIHVTEDEPRRTSHVIRADLRSLCALHS